LQGSAVDSAAERELYCPNNTDDSGRMSAQMMLFMGSELSLIEV
jgi:hypothetical protein